MNAALRCRSVNRKGRHNLNRTQRSRLLRRIAAGIGALLAVATLSAVVLIWISYRSCCGGPEKREDAKRELTTLRDAVQLFYLEKPEICPTLPILVRAGYWDKIELWGTDPWGQLYEIRCAGAETTLLSAGPDGRYDTADDLKLTVNVGPEIDEKEQNSD